MPAMPLALLVIECSSSMACMIERMKVEYTGSKSGRFLYSTFTAKRSQSCSKAIAINCLRATRLVSSTHRCDQPRFGFFTAWRSAMNPGRISSLPLSTASANSSTTTSLCATARSCSARRCASIDTSLRSLLERR